MYRISLFFLLLCAAEPGHSQTPDLPAAGARIWVHAPQYTGIGTTVPSVGDTLALRSEAGILYTLPVASLTQLQVSKGVRGNGAKGARIGAVGGAVLIGGFITLYSWFATNNSTQDKLVYTVISPAAGALYGAAPGYVVGSFVRSEKWTDLPLPRPQ